MQTNVFLSGHDPLLGGQTQQPIDFEQRIAELQQLQQKLEEQRQTRGQAQPQGGQSPLWDEIERLTADFTDREFELVNRDEEFQASQAAIAAILQREQLRMMRPIVEGTKDGREALENHLALMKRLKKKAAKEADRSMELFSEYTQHYPDMTFSDFMKMKNGTAAKEQQTQG